MSHTSSSRQQRRDNDAEWIQLPEIDISEAFDPLNTRSDSNPKTVHPQIIDGDSRDLYSLSTPSHPQSNHYRSASGDSEAQNLLGEPEPFDRGLPSHNYTQSIVSDNVGLHDHNQIGRSINVYGNATAFSKITTTRLWAPYTLRKPFLAAMASISFSLAIILVVLCWRSAHNKGLGRDDGSSMLLMGWRYTPTFIAVLFAQGMVMVLDDVQRTEPFARLCARTLGSDSHVYKHTFRFVPKVWWKMFFAGFDKKQHSGRRNMVLSLSALTTGLSLLVISTLSSSLLLSEQVVITSPVELHRYATDNDGSIPIRARRDTYFHATSAFQYNASSSVWATDDYIVFPLVLQHNESLGGSVPNGIWKAETKVCQVESSCKPMSVETRDSVNLTYLEEWDSRSFTDYSADPDSISQSKNQTMDYPTKRLGLKDDDGCEIQVINTPKGARSILRGGPLWTNLSASHVSWRSFADARNGFPFVSYAGWSPLSDSPLVEFSDECIGKNLLLVTTPWEDPNAEGNDTSGDWADFESQVQICETIYYEAMTPVTVTAAKAQTIVTFDTLDYKQRRQPLADGMLDIELLDQLTYKGNRPDYKVLSKVYGGYARLDGLLEPLTYSSNSNNTIMIRDGTLAEKSINLRGRFFTELVYSSLINQESSSLEAVSGESTTTEQRIVVATGVAAALAVLFLVAGCFLGYMMWAASIRRRPLLLKTDPATAAGVAVYFLDALSDATNIRTFDELRASRSIDERLHSTKHTWTRLKRFQWSEQPKRKPSRVVIVLVSRIP